MDVLGVGWDGREGDPPRRAAHGGGGEWAGELHCGKRMRFLGSFGVEEDRRWGLHCAAGAAAMADGGELDSGELEAGAAVGELLRDEAKLVG